MRRVVYLFARLLFYNQTLRVVPLSSSGGLKMQRTMSMDRITSLRVDTAGASDPGARRPSMRRTPSVMTASSRQRKISCPSLSISQPQEMKMEYPHVSARSLHMEIQIASPSTKIVHHKELQTSRTLPVFHGTDRVGGQVILDPTCYQSGRLTMSIEGAFQYTSPQTEVVNSPRDENTGKGRHVFFSASNVIRVGAPTDSLNPRTTAFIRDAFSTHARRRPSVSSMSSAKGSVKEGLVRCFPFAFDMPLGRQPGQEMPPTFSSSALVATGTRGRSFAERAEVMYKVTALWEPSDGYENRALLEVPVLFLPDTDFLSLDATITQPEFWLEIPLSSEKSIPFHCDIALPSPANFPRTSAVPFYVVFTTAPRSSTLAKDIATHGTITVALVRQVNVSTPPSLPPTPPLTPPSSAEDPDSPSSPRQTHRRLLSRVARSAPTILLRTSRIPEEVTSSANKPLPRLPSAEAKPFFESRTILTDLYKGFPKRPRNHKPGHRSVSKDPNSSLPDGLYKGGIQLNKNMLPSFDWPGVSVKYHLEVSVLFRRDKVEARIPIRLY